MKSKPGRYEYLEHTADAKFVAHGKTLDELFANAAEATFGIITDVSKVKRAMRFPLEVKAKTKEACLFDFLDQLLFLLDTEGFLLSGFKDLRVTRNCDNTFWATGEALGDYHKGYDVSCNVKAVTYNDMYVRIKDGGGWECQVVVDL